MSDQEIQPKVENVGADAGVQTLVLIFAVNHRRFLANELVQARSLYASSAVDVHGPAVVSAWRRVIDGDAEANRCGRRGGNGMRNSAF